MRHKGMDKDELLRVLDDMRAVVAANDSFEGSIEYLMPGPFIEDDPSLADAEFAVRASYRVGNSMGQGGLVMVGVMNPPNQEQKP